MIAFIKQHECSFQVESTEMPKHSRNRDLEVSMPVCVPPTKSAKHTTAGKAWSPHKLAKSSDTAAGKAQSPCTAAGKSQSPKLAKSSNTAAAGINIPASEIPFGIKDAVLRELIGLGKVQVVTRSSRLSRSGKWCCSSYCFLYQFIFKFYLQWRLMCEIKFF